MANTRPTTGQITHKPAVTGGVTRALNDTLDDLGMGIKGFGAVGDGTTNDSAAEVAGIAAVGALEYPYQNGEVYAGLPTANNVYGSYQNSLWKRVQSGLRASPTSRADPILFINKYSSADRSVNPSEWDNGAVYGQLVKIGGSAYGAAVTGNVRHEGGSGQMIGVHARGNGYHAGAQTWGAWIYGHISSTATTGVIQCIGAEIDMKNDGPDKGWMVDGGNGAARGLLVTTADNSTNAITVGISVQAGNRNDGTNTNTDRMWTGILIPKNSIVPTSDHTGATFTNGEYMRFEGAVATTYASGGIRLRDKFSYALSTTEAGFISNCAILLGDDHRIVVGTVPGNGTYLSFNRTSAFANFNALMIRVNNTQVVGTRKTGWAAATGTATRTTFATSTVTLPQLAERVKAMMDDLISHGLIGA